MKVSVIITACNSEKFIDDAIKSVLSQTIKDFNLIIIDDGSTDATGEIIRKYDNQLEYLYHENKGSAYTYNVGLKKATGEYVAFLDADDIWLNDRLEKHLKFFEKNSSIEFSYGMQKYFTSENENFPSVIPEPLRTDPHIGFTLSTLMLKKEVINHVGLFDEQLGSSADFDWYSRAKNLKTKIEFLNELVTLRRIHDSNLSYKNMEQQRNLRFEILKKNILRKNKSIKNNE